MKRLYLFVILMMLAASFSKTVVAQHYVKIVNNTTSTNSKEYASGDILPIEVDSAKVYYIHITEQSSNPNIRRNGVENGAKFPIDNLDTDIKKVKFKDLKGDLRNNCFRKAEIVVKVGEDYLTSTDVTFLNSVDVNKASESVKQKIKDVCVYEESGRLDLTKCPFEYIYQGNLHKDKTQYNVSPNSKIEFLTSSENIPNIIFEAKEFIKQNPTTEAKTNWLFRPVTKIVIGVVFVLCILCLGWFGLRNKKRSNKNTSDFDNFNDSTHLAEQKPFQNKDRRGQDTNQRYQTTKEETNPNKLGPQSPDVSSVDKKLYKTVADVLARVEATQKTIDKQVVTLEDIRVLVSNTEDKKQLAQKSRELDEEKKKLADAIEQRDAALSDVEKLKEELTKLQAESQVLGAVQVAEYSTFVSFAKIIISECVAAENLIIKYWSSLNGKDQQIINGFLSKFQMSKCCIDLAKWNGIIATIDLNGYIKNDEYITYLTPLSNSDRLVFLNKRFFEDVLRPYVGAVVLLLEQVRTASKIGVSVPSGENINGFINSICTKCFEQGVQIDYRKLYEKVTEYDSLEIDDNIPDAIKAVIAKIEEDDDILLYVDKYAVNLETGEMAEKTRCYIKI